MTQWTTTDGKNWSLTIGDKQAVIGLMEDEKTYFCGILWLENDALGLSLGKFDDIKEAKQACLDEIERINTQEKADKPKPPVILRGVKYQADYTEYHGTVKDAALSAYWAITDNSFFPKEIEAEGKIVWMSRMIAGDEYPSLATMAGFEDDQK